jgi:hypothetical protein
MLPDPDYAPATFSEDALYLPISREIAVEFCAPVPRVRSGHEGTTRTSMPEATINENDYFPGGESEIWTSE